VRTLEMVRSRKDLAFEKEHLLDDVPYDTSATLVAEFEGGGIVRASLRCTEEFQGKGLLCRARSCAQGQLTVAGDGPDGLTLTVGGRIDGRSIPDFVDLSTDCRAGGKPILLESGSEPLVFKLTKRATRECRP
jgi:hypothetical protein